LDGEGSVDGEGSGVGGGAGGGSGAVGGVVDDGGGSGVGDRDNGEAGGDGAAGGLQRGSGGWRWARGRGDLRNLRAAASGAAATDAGSEDGSEEQGRHGAEQPWRLHWCPLVEIAKTLQAENPKRTKERDKEKGRGLEDAARRSAWRGRTGQDQRRGGGGYGDGEGGGRAVGNGDASGRGAGGYERNAGAGEGERASEVGAGRGDQIELRGLTRGNRSGGGSTDGGRAGGAAGRAGTAEGEGLRGVRGVVGEDECGGAKAGGLRREHYREGARGVGGEGAGASVRNDGEVGDVLPVEDRVRNLQSGVAGIGDANGLREAGRAFGDATGEGESAGGI